MDDDYGEISVANNSQPADNSLATDINGAVNESPTKSRYGRLQKPKRSQDFCDIDLAIGTSQDLKSNVRTSPQKSPLKKSYQPCVPLISSETHSSPIPSVTNSPSPKATICSSSPSNVTPIKTSAARKFFKRESASTQQEKQDLESDDVTKVLKIISTKPLDSIQDNTKSTPKSALKTYSNKKKLLNKVALVESFGLPDTPIFPINSSNLTIREPALDIAPTTLEEDDIDKQLLNVPWSLDEINTEINYKNEYNAVEPQPSTSSLNRIDFYKVSPAKCDPKPIAKAITPIKSFSTKIIEQTFKQSEVVTIKSSKIKTQSNSNSKKKMSPKITKKVESKALNRKGRVSIAKKSEIEKGALEITNKKAVEFEQSNEISNDESYETTTDVLVSSKEDGTQELQKVELLSQEVQQTMNIDCFKGFSKQNCTDIADQTLDFVKSLESSIKKKKLKSCDDVNNISNLTKVAVTETLSHELINKSVTSNLETTQCEELNISTDNCQNCATDKLEKSENLTSEAQSTDLEQTAEKKKLIKLHKKPKIPKTASLTIKSKKSLLSKIENVDNLKKLKITKSKRTDATSKINENDNDKTNKERINQKSLSYQAKRIDDPLRKHMKIKRSTLRSSPRIQKDVSNSNNVNVEITNDKNILKTKNDVESDRRKSLRIRSDKIDLKVEDTKLMKKLILEENESKTKLGNINSDIPNVSEIKEQKDKVKIKHNTKDESPKRAPTKLMVELSDDEHSTSSQIDKRKSLRRQKEENKKTNMLTSSLKERDSKKRLFKLSTNLSEDSMLSNQLDLNSSISSLNSSIESTDEGDINIINKPQPFKRQKEEGIKNKIQKLSNFLNSSLECNKEDNLNVKRKKEVGVEDTTLKLKENIESTEEVVLASDKRKSCRSKKELNKNVNTEVDATDSLNSVIEVENNDEIFLSSTDRRKSLRNKKAVTEGVKVQEVNSTIDSLNSSIEIDDHLLLATGRRKSLRNKKNVTEVQEVNATGLLDLSVESLNEDFLLTNNRRKSLRNRKDTTENVKVQEINTATNPLNLSIENNNEDFILANGRKKSLRNRKELTEDVKIEPEELTSSYLNSGIGSIEEDLILINERRKSLRNRKDITGTVIDENTSSEIVDQNFAVSERKTSLRHQDEHTEHETQKLNSSVNKPDIENTSANTSNKKKSLKMKGSKDESSLELQSNEDLKIPKTKKKMLKARRLIDKLTELEEKPKSLELEELPITVETPQSSEKMSPKKEKVSPNFGTYNVIEDEDNIKKHFKSQIIDSDDDDEIIVSQIEIKKHDQVDLTEENSLDIKIKEEPNVSPDIPKIHMQEQSVEHSSAVDLTNEKEENLNKKEDFKLDNKSEIQDLNDDSKVDISEKDKTENMEYILGDLIWARIGSYPYWPCMIYADPATNKYKMNIGAIRQRPSYHLRFFGDKGRRSWAVSTSIMPYTGRNDIKNLMQKWKNNSKVYQKYIIKPYLLPKLQNAIEEAESLKASTVKERFEFFFNMFADEAEKKARLKKEEKVDEVTPVKERGKKVKTPKGERVGRAKSRSSLDKVERTSSKPLSVKSKKAKLNKSQDNSHGENMEQNSIADTSSPQKNLGEKSNNLLDDLGDSLQKNSWQGIELRKKHIITPLNEVNSECSFSDSDTISKSSSNVSANDLFKVEIVRYKKCSIFKGVSRERVCQVCYKPGDILKCKGPCGGLFHADCAQISSKEVKQEKLETIEIEMANNVAVSNSTLNILDPELSNSCGDVEIVEIDSDSDSSDYSHMLTTKVNVMSSEEFKLLSLPEKIDIKMQELMETVEKKTRYADSTTDEGSSEESGYDPSQETANAQGLVIQHVTADSIIFGSPGGTPVEDIHKRKKVKTTTKQKRILMNEPSPATGNINDDSLINSKDESKDFKCNYCSAGLDPPCHICHMQISSKDDTILQKCSLHMCGKFYHSQCLKKLWPQTQWSLISTAKHKNSDKQLDTFVCPMHVCHTCISDNPRAASSRCSSSKVVRCLQCPATYHSTNYCVPAGTEILSCSDVICPRHFVKDDTINTPWCFVCSEGGELICCETCPTSVHSDCLHINLLDDDTFVCEDCESGRFPLYDEVVWVKLGSYRWWPAVILFPCEVPEIINNIMHVNGQFVVKFFGTHDYFWVSKGRVFLFQEGDRGYTSSSKNKVNSIFNTSIEEATRAHEFKKLFKLNQAAEIKIDNKPPPYVKIKMNRPVGNVRQIDANISNTTPCECNPDQPNPCGPDSYCINRLLWTECDPNVCPAQNKCNNQRFEKRQYPPLVPHKTETRGWGLKTLAAINKGDFVIEYVGEVIDDQEYQRRILKMHEQKDENYYFLTIDKDRIIDAGPKGNLARFMNHCCQPNCETQKWTVNGDTRVGLFAFVDIPEGSELTFNYNLECVGTEKKICNCGAPNCSGFIGVKVKDESQKKSRKSTNSAKKKKASPPQIPKNDGPCFICRKTGEVGTCHNKICNKFYHLECVNLEYWPEGKWVCPWHNCNVCTKRTIRCCVKCLNSYCPVHSEGNVRYDKLLGFVCSEHDPTKESHELETPLIIKSNSSSVLTTEETDITSTTSEELVTSASSSSCDLNSTANVESTSMDSLTSTPKQRTDDRQSSSEEEKKLEKQIKSPSNRNRKRKARQSGGGRQHKKTKSVNPSLSPTKSKPKPNSISLVSISMQNEIKLSSTVPVRHLRTTRNSPHLNIEVERFLKHQSEVEKGLPFRKRSRLRYENNL